MEIRIKTAEEFRDAHVTIEIRATPAEAEVVAERLGEAEKLLARIVELEADLAVAISERSEMNARRVAAWTKVEELEAELERYRTAHVCTTRCSINSHVAFEGNQIVKALEAELVRRTQERDEREAARSDQEAEAEQGRQMIIDLAREMEAERQRANENRDWAERAEGRLAAFALDRGSTKRELDEACRVIEDRNAQLARISGAVHGVEISQTLRRTYEAWEPRTMAEVIRQVRDALGTPVLPETSGGATSQA